MNKLMNQLEEYFLGTETRKFYSYQRNEYREFITDNDILKKLLNASKIEEKADLLIGKFLPIAIDAGALAYSLITRTPPYGIILGEGLRVAYAGPSLTIQRRNKKMSELFWKRYLVSEILSDIDKKINDITDKFDEEGEEWKNT